MFPRNHANSGKESLHLSHQDGNGQNSSAEEPNWLGGMEENQHGVLSKRLLWFRTRATQRPKLVTLIDRFESSGMDVQILDAVQGAKLNGATLHCALIMLECVDMVEQEMLSHLAQVRSNSNAPLIILTDNATLDWSLLALREGADAIFTLNTQDEVILARSSALLRRWAAD